MRLLRRSSTGEFSLEDLAGNDTIPPYAILSHTWGADTDEVTFEDLTNGIGKDKPGYEKIRFCGDQAWRDRLQYFWIDTCCINKANKGELSLAINSMFRWYCNSTRCYVYLSDVSSSPSLLDANEESNPLWWELNFRTSRWFTRGWTLQEVLAPSSVEFFSQEHKRLGDIRSLMLQIHEITGIPKSALQGAPLSQFSVNERLSWIQHRQTKLEEDKAYSLLGIFDVYIPPLYGEGTARAFKRLQDEIDKLEKCIQDLHLTDPRDDKKRIEDIKGGLLKDSYRWILYKSDFRQWRDDSQSRLLWIKGDPGKGKTMLLCGIVNELKTSIAKTDLLSYFFCQATDSRINNATAVLRGLVYLLVSQQPSLISHIRKKHDHAGKALFEDANAWVALSDIFTNILQDPSLNSTYLIIDALDECIADLPKLLDFVIQKSSISRRAKWIVSSRNQPNIEERLERAGHKVRLCLELNTESISTAVSIFIQHKVLQLAHKKKYSRNTQNAVLEHLSSNANNTFLWVALVCQNLENTPQRKTLAKLNAFPPGLDSLYERMMQQIRNLDDADANLCKAILTSIAIVYRPITLKELISLVKLPKCMEDNLELLLEIISLCGSFLTIQEGTIYFVHQSAKDFLFTKAFHEIFPSKKEEAHYAIFSRSLQVMSRTLRRDMYSLGTLGYPAKRVQQPDPDLLAASRYSCIYWIDHLCEWNPRSSDNYGVALHDGGTVDSFIRKKYLYWLEALSLCKSMSEGLVSIKKLEALIQGEVNASALIKLVQDARRFIMYHKWAIENSPLQAYASALVFSPARSQIRDLFKEEELKWITIKPAMGYEWGACLQTLEGHSHWVQSVAFSHDSTWLASASDDRTVKIWNASSGACLQTLEGHSRYVHSVAFSHDSTRLASASYDRTVKIWDASSGACLQTLEGHSSPVYSVVFSHDSTWLASASYDRTVKIWDASSGACLQTLKGHSRRVRSVAFSHDSTQLASASDDSTVKIWDASSGACLQTLEGHGRYVHSVAFSYNSTQLASASDDRTVKIWDASSGACLQTLKGHSYPVSSVAFSHNSTRLASASDDYTVKIWDASSGACLQTLEGHSRRVRSVAFSHDSTWLASASYDRTVKIWDASSGECLQTLKGHSRWVQSVAFSHDSTRLASASDDSTVKIWDASNSACLQTLKGHSRYVHSVAFSHNSNWLASASDDRTVKIWDASSGACLQTLKGHSYPVYSVAFSHDSTQLASASDDSTVKIWDASSGACLQTLKGHSHSVRSVAFSHDSTRLASASYDRTVKIWDASNSACLQTLKGHSYSVSSVAFSHDSTQLASASDDSTVKIWDASGACLQTLKGHSHSVSSVAFSHNSTWLASASYDRTVKIWDASSGACLQTLKGHSSPVRSVAFSHDLTRLASASYDRTVKIWDASSGACLQTLEGHSNPVSSAGSGACLQTLQGHSNPVSSVAFSHDSTWLASASYDSTVKIWDASSGACLQTLEGHSSSVYSVAFSHDSTQLASASDDRTVKIWDASSGGACLQTLKGHSSPVRSVAFSHDSTQLASASDDSTVKIWDVSSGARLQTLKGHSSPVRSVAFSHDSTWLASASYDRTVKIWDASSGACLQTLDVGKVLSNISFNTTSSYLHTEIGTITISAAPSVLSSTLTVTEPQNPRYQGLALSSDGVWITHNSDNVVWLPSEYRPSCSTVLGKTIGIGVGTGRVWICESSA